MKLFLILITLYQVTNGWSQVNYTPVDRKEIEKAVTDPGSPNQYPALLNKYLDFDSTLSLEQYRLLYYGFVFQPAYNGYNDNRGREIRELIQKKEFIKAITACDEVLQTLPVSLTINYLKGLALFSEDKNDTTWQKYRDRYFRLLTAIVSSGDGLECKTAFKTIFVADEYEIIYRYFDIEKSLGQSLQTPCDLLRVVPSEKYTRDKIYFDTSETLNGMQKMFKGNE